MPIIQIELLPRTTEQKRKLVAALTETTCQVLGCPADAVKIIIHDMPPENYSTAGILRCDE
jgi:4-oxalocrotonate tautomerase